MDADPREVLIGRCYVDLADSGDLVMTIIAPVEDLPNDVAVQVPGGGARRTWSRSYSELIPLVEAYEQAQQIGIPVGITVVNAHFSMPMNAAPGLYIQLKGNRELLTHDAGVAAAGRVARRLGFDPNGHAEAASWPTSEGLTNISRCYWFYDVGGKPYGLTREGRAVAEQATHGPNAIYELEHYDPRLV